VRFALGLEYNGAGYCGWQRQPNRCSIQDQVESALKQIAAHPVEVVAAGRTDAGVHASLQVVHFDTAARRPLTAWVRGSNAHLPSGIAVLWAQQVDAQFHARFCARGRGYRYLLLNHPVRPAALSGAVGWYHLPLDIAAMHAAAQRLLGEHDFSSFRSAHCQAPSPVRQLRQARVRGYGAFIEFSFQANAFLHHMVRNIVGSLVEIGSGKRAQEWLSSVLEARTRLVAAPTFAPSGLYLAQIEYDQRWGLPAQTGRLAWLDAMVQAQPLAQAPAPQQGQCLAQGQV
jgi:tRNA pseudouridine38-40 synthase